MTTQHSAWPPPQPRAGEGPPLAAPGAAALPRLLHGATALAEHTALHGRVPLGRGAAALTALTRDAGLTGYGGAAFPVHRKLAAVAAAGQRTGRRPVVVANGSEGEPASLKDKTLLRLDPHLVLDGVQLAAEAVGAGEAYLAVEHGSGLRPVLTRALGERRDPVPVRLAEGPRRFLAGESSALVNRLSGGPALPARPFTAPRVSGVGRAPTLVQNVETLAQLALAARYGPGWFRALGTAAEPGSLLTTVHTAGRPAQVVEAAHGTAIGRLLTGGPLRAVLVGGYHGTWLPADLALRLPLSSAALAPYGAAPGAGVLAGLPMDRCGLAETARVLRWLALESAGQCGPCVNGLPRMAAAFAEVAGPGANQRQRADLARWSGLVSGRGACHHPDGTARLVRSALTVFADELDAHAAGWCTATDPAPLLPVPEEE